MDSEAIHKALYQEIAKTVGYIISDDEYMLRLCGKIDKETIIHTDGWRGYNGLVDVGYDKHFRVNHSKNEFSKGNGIHINGIESFWSFTKRRLAKFNGVKINFYLHLKECEWRWKMNENELQEDLIRILKKYFKEFN